MMPLDDDGFSVQESDASTSAQQQQSEIRRPPPMADVGKTFDGCASTDEAIVKVINELSAPASIQVDGYDTMYRRLADGLIVLLAHIGGLTP
jgi:hypothetical protein